MEEMDPAKEGTFVSKQYGRFIAKLVICVWLLSVCFAAICMLGCTTCNYSGERRAALITKPYICQICGYDSKNAVSRWERHECYFCKKCGKTHSYTIINRGVPGALSGTWCRKCCMMGAYQSTNPLLIHCCKCKSNHRGGCEESEQFHYIEGHWRRGYKGETPRLWTSCCRKCYEKFIQINGEDSAKRICRCSLLLTADEWNDRKKHRCSFEESMSLMYGVKERKRGENMKKNKPIQ